MYLLILLQERLQNKSTGTATTVANTSASKLTTLSLENTQKCHKDTGTTGTERVTNGNSTSVNVHLVFGQVEQFHVGEGNDTESFVDLEGVNLVLSDTGLLEGLGDGESGGCGEFAGLLGGVRKAEDLSDGLEVEFFQFGFGDEDDGGSTVVEGRGVGSGDGTGSGDESGLDCSEFIRVELHESVSVTFHVRL